ncbi:hypothetical protein F5Y16DRAFT_397084 [Xylariaceae sp. FL0255]|nr:hypothetical protein F5Y16DRAFT_397084 [Xylariaceae sp. FL0255]
MSHTLEAVPFSTQSSASSRQQEGELSRNPTLIRRLCEELAEHGIKDKGGSGFVIMGLQKLLFLNAIMNNTLRLHPPVPEGVPRHVPPEGIVMNSVFVPPDTRIMGPICAIHSSSYTFVESNSLYQSAGRPNQR